MILDILVEEYVLHCVIAIQNDRVWYIGHHPHRPPSTLHDILHSMATIQPAPHQAEKPVFREAKPEEIIELRHAILRKGLPRESAIFPGDDLPSTHHFVALADGQIICCLTLLQSDWNNQPAWQLRGMATSEAWQNKGIGARLMQYAINQIRQQTPHTSTMWCNARVTAMRFYQKLSWQIASEPFDIPTAGPHVKMTLQL